MEPLTFGGELVRAVVLPHLGGRLHRLTAFGHDVLRTPPDLDRYQSEPFFWASYPMAPWCNRIGAGATIVGGREVHLESNFPDGSAIHGQAYRLRWEATPDGSLRVRGGGHGWPWEYEVAQVIAVEGASVRMQLILTNHSTEPMPGGVGIHPWFRTPIEVAIHGDACHPSNLESAGEPAPVQGVFDRRSLEPMPPDLDATWTALGDPVAELRWPDVGISAAMRSTGRYLVAASPSALDAVAIEPQTHAPHGLRRMLEGGPGALALIGPGDTLDLEVELAFQRR